MYTKYNPIASEFVGQKVYYGTKTQDPQKGNEWVHSHHWLIVSHATQRL